MATTRWSRRHFLTRAGQIAGASVLGAGLDLGTLARGAVASPGAPSSSPATARVLDLDDPELQAILADLVRQLETKALYASAFAEHSGGMRARASRREKSITFEAERKGVVFQAYDGTRFREIAIDHLDADALARAARDLLRELSLPPAGAAGPEAGPALRRIVQSPFEVDPERVAPARWLDAAADMSERLHARDARILNASGGCSHDWRRTLFVNRARTIRQTIQTAGVSVFAFARENGKPAPTFYQSRGVGGFERTTFRPDQLEHVGQLVEDLLRAERIAPGTYEVVSAPPITGLLAHESFGHGVEYDQFIKERAKAAHFLGKRVAPDIVSIWDDPTQAGSNGTYWFDDEGWEATPTAIVEHGIFRRPITDLFSSFAGTAERTGNGRRESYANKAYARMSNTYFGRGGTPVEELVGTLENGIYLDGFQSGIEDPHGWGIQFTCNRGYEIRNGKRTGRVFNPVAVTGYVPDILGSITHVGDDFELVPGSCGKGFKEMIPVGSGGPHLRFTAQLG